MLNHVIRLYQKSDISPLLLPVLLDIQLVTLRRKEPSWFDTIAFWQTYNSTSLFLLSSPNFFYFFLMQIDQLFVSKSPHGPHVLNLTHFSFLKIIYCPCPSVRDLMSGSWKTSSVTQKSQTFLLTTAYSVKLAMDLEIFQNVGISKFKIQCSQDDIPCSKLWFLNELSASVLATRFMHN